MPTHAVHTIKSPGHTALHLLPEKAAWLPAARTLLVADPHFGKAAVFRARGIPVPRGSTGGSLQTLSMLVTRLGATQLIFLGDFMHARESHSAGTLDALAQFRAAHAGCAMTLVRGNHDSHAGDPPPALNIAIVDEPLIVGSLALKHHPEPEPHHYVLAGHLHPCVRLAAAGDSARLPCFWMGERVGVLPAFGEFTGMHPVRAAAGERLYAVTEERVFALPPQQERAAS
ncbi:DEAD/DEAH box helicase [beta proteobacterium AAP99]|nr:DEAD/DEAH box helicase [beta proteobacterium AAP99]